MTPSHLGRTRGALLALIAVTLLCMTAVSSAQAGTSKAHVASAASISSHSAAATLAATRARSRAEALVSSRRRRLAKCVKRHPSRCDAIREAIDRASSRVAAANARLNEIKTAPILTVSDQTLTWNAIEGVETYVVVRTVAGRTNSRWIVSGTTITPRALPGRTASFTVRTLTRHSEASQPVTISYPAATPPAEGSTPPVSTEGEPKTEPKGEPKTEEKTSETPVSGPKGKKEEGKKTESKEESPSTGGGFETGVVPTTLSSTEPATVKQLGARSVRMEFAIGEPASALASAVEAYARAGIRVMPLAGFYGRLPSPAEARNLASWADTYGPGGSFWAGKSFPASVAVTDIEFGNETSYSYQFSDNSTAGVTNRAETYALRFKEAEIAVKEADSSVGMLAQADDGGSGSPTWVNGMFQAVPDLASRVAGWTVHPYGTTWEAKMDDLVKTTAAHGAGNIPIYVTELGIAVDNGKCLSNNYGWNPCMTNSEAASTLAGVVGTMHSRYGSKLRALYLYQAQDERAEGASNDRELYFGCLQANGASKGAYTTEVESVLASGSGSTASASATARVASLHKSVSRHHRTAARTRTQRHKRHHQQLKVS